jgi:hypothetical protein
MMLKHPLFFAGGLGCLTKTQTRDMEDTEHEGITVIVSRCTHTVYTLNARTLDMGNSSFLLLAPSVIPAPNSYRPTPSPYS